MKKDTVTLKTDTLAELMGMALLAANADNKCYIEDGWEFRRE